MPEISVILPAYNVEKWIFQSINSILSQTFKDFELILINDGSYDNTEKIIKSFKDKRIKYFKNKKNIGLIKSLNNGIKFSKGKFIARMDGDDICHPDRLKKQINFLKKNPLIDVLGTGILILDSKNKIKKKKIFPQTNNLIKIIMPMYCCICHASVMFKKSLFEEIGFYEENAKHIEDYKLWLKAYENNKIFFNIKELLYYVRIHKLSSTQINKKYHENKAANIGYKFYRKIFKKKIEFKIYKCFFFQGKVEKTHAFKTLGILFNYLIYVTNYFFKNNITFFDYIYLEYLIIKRGCIIFVRRFF